MNGTFFFTWILVAVCLLPSVGSASSTIGEEGMGIYEATFDLVQNGNSLYLDLYLRTTNGTSAKLGNATFRFTFNNSALLFVGKDAAFDGRWDNGNSADYTDLAVTADAIPSASFIVGKSSSGSGLDIPTTATRVGRMVFTIRDPNLTPGILWDQTSPVEDWNGGSLLVIFVDPALDLPLPVQLVSFTGAAGPGTSSVVLTWATLSESNNYGFTLQRRIHGEAQFVDLQNSFIPGHGTTIQPQNYSFLDNTIRTTGQYEYRLKQQDLDGALHFSDVVKVTVVVTGIVETAPLVFQLRQNYPNPFNPTTVISYQLPVASHVRLVVYDQTGRVVATLVDENKPAGVHTGRLDASRLASGVYLYRIEAGSFSTVKKMVLVR
jgi:hypothetical protein